MEGAKRIEGLARSEIFIHEAAKAPHSVGPGCENATPSNCEEVENSAYFDKLHGDSASQ
jgi:hypothetical protein